MNSTQAKQIPIENFLGRLNHSPVKERGTDLWYKSPLREVDNTPSFKVNRILNTWYDFGLEKGGSIIDLACCMFNDNVSQVLKRLSSDFGTYTPVMYHQPVKQQLKTESTLRLDKVCNISEQNKGSSHLFSNLKTLYTNNKGFYSLCIPTRSVRNEELFFSRGFFDLDCLSNRPYRCLIKKEFTNGK